MKAILFISKSKLNQNMIRLVAYELMKTHQVQTADSLPDLRRHKFSKIIIDYDDQRWDSEKLELQHEKLQDVHKILFVDKEDPIKKDDASFLSERHTKPFLYDDLVQILKK